MAKLLSYYRLCPLIDLKSLLGVSGDKDRGVVVVTLGKNIAIRFRFSDQKQLSSWRTKDKLSCAVVFDKKQEKYVAVFNENIIKMWRESDVTLDQLKKYKFNQPIKTLFIHKEEIHIAFKCGSIYPLEEVLESRKTFIPEKILENEEIEEFLHCSVNEQLFVGYLVKKDKDLVLFWSEYNIFKNKFSRIRLKREKLSARGCIFHWERDAMQLLTVWEDKRMYSHSLKAHPKEISELGELVTAIDTISCSQSVKMTSLNENYVAIYGADSNQEGAVLLIYNTQFKVIQSKQAHKLFTDDSKMWQVESNLLVPVGQNLVVVPFRLESEQLAALVGSHKPVESKIDSDISIVHEFEVANWQNGESNQGLEEKNVPKSFEKQLKELASQGLPESLILSELIPQILEEGNAKALDDSLKYFTDIPEKYLVDVLVFLLTVDKNAFTNQTKHRFSNFPTKLQPKGRTDLIDKILTRTYSEDLILPHLRSKLRNVENVVLILKYIIFLLSEDGHNLTNLNAIVTEHKLINWCMLLIDSSYLKIILSKDNEVETVLLECKKLVLQELEAIEILEQTCPVLDQVVQEAKGNSFVKNGLQNNKYSVEQIVL